MDALYTATATASGDGRNGRTESEDGVLAVDVRVPKEMGGPGGATNPEQLFAAGYAACFHSALKLVGQGEGADLTGSEVSASVAIGTLDSGGFGLAVELDVTRPQPRRRRRPGLGAQGTRGVPLLQRHSIAASFGYPDGEQIPLDLMLEQVGRIVDDTDLPVTADLEGGYGDAAETIRRAIGIGVVGANIEDQMKPLPEAAAQVEAIMKVAEDEGVDFVLNARTDVYSLDRKGDPAEKVADAIERGKAYLDAGAPVVFVPAFLNEGGSTSSSTPSGRNGSPRSASPARPSPGWQQEHGVARTSYGPMSQNVALTALQELVEDVHRGGGVPSTMRLLA